MWSTIVELKQVLLSTLLFLRIKDRPFHNGEFFTDFYASEKIETIWKRLRVTQYIQKLQNISDLYISF